MAGGSGSHVRRGIDALSKFKTKVDDALRTFEDAPGGPSKVAQHRLERSSFGGANAPFHEAVDLHGQYERVHERLTYLSKSLGLQIEALTLATRASDGTYDGAEAEVERRFWEIKSHLDEEHKKATEPHDKKPESHDKKPEPLRETSKTAVKDYQ
ncbi:hypothetical protein GTW40_10595 [Streptomyces sp. SID4985]|uniref:hypothetical protein n=1 Tax=unclassified Streptomyces TaxID=2593676 RepID=UPI0013683EAF|nr:hypothetical protein [Streptomyces sp. SID4985]